MKLLLALLFAHLCATDALSCTKRGQWTRRGAMKAAAALSASAGSAGMVSAIEARPTFIEARQDGKDDREAARLLKQVSFEDLIMKSKANKEAEVLFWEIKPILSYCAAPRHVTVCMPCAGSRSLDGS